MRAINMLRSTPVPCNGIHGRAMPMPVTCREARGNTAQRQEGKETRQRNTHHGNVGLGSVLEPGEELSRSAGYFRVRLSLVPERVEESVVLVLHGVERDRGVLLLQLAHASCSKREGSVLGGGVVSVSE